MSETKHYVTYFHPGSFFAEEESRSVPKRDAAEAAKNAPRSAFAFEFFDVTETVVDGEKLRGRPKNISGRYYLGGETYTLPQVQRKYPEHTILISNMSANGWKKVIRTPLGNWQPLKAKDKVVAISRSR